MKKTRLLFFLLILQVPVFTQVIIQGSAIGYEKKKIALYKIDDYISNHETLIQEGLIDERGYFKISAQIPSIEKYIIRVQNSYAYLYLQKNSTYTIEIPKNEDFNKVSLNKKEVEITLFDLDSNDINYKILGFQAWMDTYLSNIYFSKEADENNFIKQIVAFKNEVESVYANDTSTYFIDFLKYSIGQNIENLKFRGSSTNDDKNLFYFEGQDILYKNDAYMEYLKSFYKKYLFQIKGVSSKDIYTAIVRGDLYLTDSLLKLDSYLKDDQFRELVLLNLLREESYSSYIPKSSIISIIQNVSLESNFEENVTIAKNLLANFNFASIGFRFPEISIGDKESPLFLSTIKDKYFYIHAFDPTSPKCINEIAALKKLYDKYGKQIEFITIYLEPERAYSKVEQRNLDALNWRKRSYKVSDPIWENLQIISFPYYMLVDDSYYLLASPALSPIPNNNYQSIEKTLYDIIHRDD